MGISSGEARSMTVILAMGQSNFVMTPALPWAPTATAKIWNWATDGTVGTAFVPLSSSTIGIMEKVASDIAFNSTSPVYLIKIAFGGISISHWLPGTLAPDMYQNTFANVPAALAACGATQVDYLDWWQGEGDSVPFNSSYAANFETLITRLKGNSWFPANTPVIIHGIASVVDGEGVNPNANLMNATLKALVAADPVNRSFVYTSALHGSTYWDASNPGHMTGVGYFYAGVLSSAAHIKDAWVKYTPSLICQNTGLPPTSGSATGSYKIGGTTVTLQQTGTITTAGPCGQSIAMSLPIPALDYTYVGIAYDSGVTAKSGGAVITPLFSLTQTASRVADGTTFARDGAIVTTAIEYEIPH